MLFRGDGYVKDLMKQYGDRGKPYQLPNVDHDMYQRGMQFREQEKEYYRGLEERADRAEYTAYKFAELLDQFLTINHERADVAPDASGGGGHTDPDDGGGVLPAQDRANADDTDHGQSKTLISRSKKGQQHVDANVDSADAARDGRLSKPRGAPSGGAGAEPDAGKVEPPLDGAPEVSGGQHAAPDLA